ncbi:MAG TPA: hypothetical protein GX391_08135 [Firmicutes bacterium]|jgi:hypothetical protein|nr:hypothetical protein [Bacillota bacterium]HOQ23121.1 ABC-2 transporter permease [Bacillota bacterium]HPT67018.1 ABC-2 transporter permease [Bacillota bacterium]
MKFPRPLLLKKELHQNSLFYLFPLPFVLALAVLKITCAFAGLPWLIPLFSVGVPFTLAVAYGLQAFDIEEDQQTRDFLLVKPLSILRIVTEKYLIGLTILLFWAVTFWWLCGSSYFELPQALSVGSWAGWLILAGIILTYSCSFLAGLWIQGPKKLLAVLLLTPLMLGWAFLAWSSWATFFLHNFTLQQTSWVIPLFLIVIAFAVSGSIILLTFQTVIWLLQQRPSLRETPGLTCSILPPVLLLLLGLLLNLALAVPLRISNFIGAELFGLEKPAFWTLEGAWNPRNNLLAVSGPNYRIALASLGKTPKVLYQSDTEKKGIIPVLAWSPRGDLLAFEEDGKIYLLNTREKQKPVWVGNGTNPCWSQTGEALLFASAESYTTEAPTKEHSILLFHQVFYHVDIKTGIVRPYLEFDAVGNHWTWDDANDAIWYVSPAGELVRVTLKEGFSFHPVPGVPSGRPIIYARFYRVNHPSPKFIVTLYYLNQNKRQHVDVYFYLLDPVKAMIKPLHHESGLNLTTLILHPQTGTYLLGRNGAFTKRQIPKFREVLQ